MNLTGLKTYIGILVTAIAFVLKLMGFEYDPAALSDFLTQSINDLLVIAGLLYAAYGRYMAWKSIEIKAKETAAAKSVR